MQKLLLPLLFLLAAQFAYSQRTVGLLSYQPAKSYDGFNLLYPHNQPNVYLLDNCGQIVHVWEDDANWRPGNTAYILPDGRLIKTKRPASVAGNPIWAGGGGGIVEIRDWDNNLLWSFEMNDSLRRLHHDIQPMPNGNILLIAWEAKTVQQVIEAGMDTSLLAQEALWPDMLLEINPQTDSIVWEWHAWDHLIQDFDSTKANYGVVEEHPELIDLNYASVAFSASWMHVNAIDYDPVNDHIIISVPTFSETWILDHSTTTAQAASHSGGISGRGGDLLYRWGNPAAYRAGSPDDQQLFFQHDVHWLDDFVDPSHPFYRKVALFNNRVGNDYSAGVVFTPPYDMYSASFPMNGSVWGPEAPDWVFTYPGDSTQMYSNIVSSIQLLPNGNFLFCVGRPGYSFEVTPDDEIVWEYVTPLLAGQPVAQGTVLQPTQNLTFRLKRYPADYSAFEGKDLSPMGYLELDPDSTYCDNVLPAQELFEEYQLKIFPNPANDLLTVEWEAGKFVTLEIFDLLGRKKWHSPTHSSGRKYLDTSDWLPGMYFVRINGKATTKILVNH